MAQKHGLQIAGSEAGSFGQSREHIWPKLFAIMKGKDEIRPAVSLERSMRSGLAFDSPSNALEGSQNSPCFCRGPVAQAAWKVTFKNSGGASPCSRRSAMTRNANACT